MYLGKIVRVVLTAAAFATAPAPAPAWHAGFAARYDPGVMRTAAANNGLVLRGCGIAIDGPPLGAIIAVKGVRTGVKRTCTKADWSKPEDVDRHVAAGLVELDHASARAVCGRWWRSRWKECPIVWAVAKE